MSIIVIPTASEKYGLGDSLSSPAAEKVVRERTEKRVSRSIARIANFFALGSSSLIWFPRNQRENGKNIIL